MCLHGRHALNQYAAVLRRKFLYMGEWVILSLYIISTFLIVLSLQLIYYHELMLLLPLHLTCLEFSIKLMSIIYKYINLLM